MNTNHAASLRMPFTSRYVDLTFLGLVCVGGNYAQNQINQAGVFQA